ADRPPGADTMARQPACEIVRGLPQLAERDGSSAEPETARRPAARRLQPQERRSGGQERGGGPGGCANLGHAPRVNERSSSPRPFVGSTPPLRDRLPPVSVPAAPCGPPELDNSGSPLCRLGRRLRGASRNAGHLTRIFRRGDVYGDSCSS